MEWLLHQYMTNAGETALIDEKESWTYARLYHDVIHLAGAVRQHIPFGNAVIAMYLPNSATFVKLIHAIRWTGHTILPLHISSTPEEILSVLSRAKPAAVITDSAHKITIEAGLPSPNPFVILLEELLEIEAQVVPEPVIPADISTILTTSGSMGESKLVPHSMAQHEASALASLQNIFVEPGNNWLCALPLSHAGGLSIVFRSIVYGSAMTIMERFSGPEVVRMMREHEVTHISLVPTMLRGLLDAPKFTRDRLPKLQTILVGGAKVPETLCKRLVSGSFSARISYGMSEAASQIATTTGDTTLHESGTAAMPLQGVEVEIRDESGIPLAAGAHGSIWVKSAMMLRSYYNDDSKSERFQDGWFQTGDLGHLAEDGSLFVTQRGDRIIISGGENIDPGEVEKTLQQLSVVWDVVVVGLPDEKWGETVAAAVESMDPNLKILTLMDYCREHLAAYKIPKRWLITTGLPRTSSGKIAISEVKELEFKQT